jgi:hypothetical protein
VKKLPFFVLLILACDVLRAQHLATWLATDPPNGPGLHQTCETVSFNPVTQVAISIYSTFDAAVPCDPGLGLNAPCYDLRYGAGMGEQQKGTCNGEIGTDIATLFALKGWGTPTWDDLYVQRMVVGAPLAIRAAIAGASSPPSTPGCPVGQSCRAPCPAPIVCPACPVCPPPAAPTCLPQEVGAAIQAAYGRLLLPSQVKAGMRLKALPWLAGLPACP